MKTIIRFIFVMAILACFIRCDIPYTDNAEWGPNVTYSKGNTCYTVGTTFDEHGFY